METDVIRANFHHPVCLVSSYHLMFTVDNWTQRAAEYTNSSVRGSDVMRVNFGSSTRNHRTTLA